MQDRRKPGISASLKVPNSTKKPAGSSVPTRKPSKFSVFISATSIDRASSPVPRVERFALAKRATASASSRKAGFKLGSAANLAKRGLKFSRPVRRVSFTAHAPRTNICASAPLLDVDPPSALQYMLRNKPRKEIQMG